MPDPTKDISNQDEVIDVILHQRRERNDTLQPGQDHFPDHLLRESRNPRYTLPHQYAANCAVMEVRGAFLG